MSVLSLTSPPSPRWEQAGPVCTSGTMMLPTIYFTVLCTEGGLRPSINSKIRCRSTCSAGISVQGQGLHHTTLLGTNVVWTDILLLNWIVFSKKVLSRERRSRFHAVVPLTQAGGRCEMEPMPFGWTGGFRVYLGKRFGWKKGSLLLSIAQFLVLKREKTAKSQSPFRAFKIKLLLKYSGQFNVKNYKVYSGFFCCFLENAMFKENISF